MVFLWFSYGLPMVFLWFSYGLPGRVSTIFHQPIASPGRDGPGGLHDTLRRHRAILRVGALEATVGAWHRP